MTLSWGNKLILTFVVFAVFMSVLVYKCTQYNVDLVSTQYYADELRYQDRITGINNASKISKPLITQHASGIILQLPKELHGQTIEGRILFYCVSNSVNDRTIPIALNANGQQLIRSSLFPAQHYIAKIMYTANGIAYYSEQPVTIQ